MRHDINNIVEEIDISKNYKGKENNITTKIKILKEKVKTNTF